MSYHPLISVDRCSTIVSNCLSNSRYCSQVLLKLSLYVASTEDSRLTIYLQTAIQTGRTMVTALGVIKRCSYNSAWICKNFQKSIDFSNFQHKFEFDAHILLLKVSYIFFPRKTTTFASYSNEKSMFCQQMFNETIDLLTTTILLTSWNSNSGFHWNNWKL